MHDWNGEPAAGKPSHAFDVCDETLRDGLQSPSVKNPSRAEKLELLTLMSALGAGAASIGLPGAGAAVMDDVVALARHAEATRMDISLTCAARTLVADVEKIATASQRSGRPLAVYAFIGSSPMRQWIEGWDVPFLVRASREALDFAVREGLEVAFVTEDTTRSSPADLDVLFRNAMDAGARRIVLCDTVGHATPDGARALVGWTARLIARVAPETRIDWHGHDDRGLALANSLAALEAGAHRIHGCGLGIGERVGNTSLDVLVRNLALRGWASFDEAIVDRYADAVGRACGVEIPRGYPRFERGERGERAPADRDA